MPSACSARACRTRSRTSRSSSRSAPPRPADGAAKSTAGKRSPARATARSVGLRQAEHALGDEAKDELAAHRRDAADERFAQVALDVVLGGVAEAAEGHDCLLAG